MATSKIAAAMAPLRSLAARGDHMANVLVKVLDALLANQKEMVIAVAATTANRTLSGLTNTALDGVTPVAGEVILVKNQSTGSQNGLYVAASGAWSRLTDDDGKDVLASGMLVVVKKGSTLADTIWMLETDTFTVGTTSLTFGQVAGASGVGTSDLADGAVTAPKLAEAVQQGIFGTPTITPAAEDGSDNIDITIQAKDINGDDLDKKVELLVWLSDTDVDTVGTALTAFAVQGTGTLLKADTANLMLRVLTDANGVAVLRGTIAGAASRFVNVLVGGDVHARSAQINWAA